MAKIDEHIRKAMEDGKFKDLPGKGKPLNLDDNPHADPEWSLANHMLQSAGFTLPWIQLRKEIDSEIDQARAALERAWNWRCQALSQGQDIDSVEGEWQRALHNFHDQVQRINQRIADYNLQTPSDGFQRLRLNPEREVQEITNDRE